MGPVDRSCVWSQPSKFQTIIKHGQIFRFRFGFWIWIWKYVLNFRYKELTEERRQHREISSLLSLPLPFLHSFHYYKSNRNSEKTPEFFCTVAYCYFPILSKHLLTTHGCFLLSYLPIAYCYTIKTFCIVAKFSANPDGYFAVFCHICTFCNNS